MAMYECIVCETCRKRYELGFKRRAHVRDAIIKHVKLVVVVLKAIDELDDAVNPDQEERIFSIHVDVHHEGVEGLWLEWLEAHQDHTLVPIDHELGHYDYPEEV